MMTLALNDEAERCLAATFYVVKATSFERLILWGQHSVNSAFPPINVRKQERAFEVLKWEELNSSGGLVTVGKVLRPRRGRKPEPMPVTLHFSFARIEGRMVCFWESTSITTDSEQIEAWLAKHCPCWKATEGHCDANNFGHCISAIKRANHQE